MNTTYYRRPAILGRPELKKGHAVIEASAGTGKTFTLEHLVLNILIRNEDINIEQILVVTFTDAATRELRERVRALIRKVCDESGALEPGENPADYWAIDDRIRGRLREALFRFDGAAISTIHSFCQRVLSEQAFLGGRLFEQEIAAGEELFGFAFREEIRVVLAEDGSTGKMLREWVEEGGRLLELAGFLYQCHREGCPDRCPLTPLWDPECFRQSMAEIPELEELKATVEPFYGEKKLYAGLVKIIDSLAETLAAMRETDHPATAADLFLDWAEKKRSINKIKKTQWDYLVEMARLPGAPAALGLLVEKLKDIAGRAANETAFFARELLPRVQARLASRKQSLGLIDYDDMLVGVLEALQSEQAPVLLDLLRHRWTVALVDEFQDTDPVQWEIFRKIFVEATEKHRLIVIGDLKQAIYSFRGADVHTYEEARSYLVNLHGASLLPLTENYRSTKTMIEAVNEIIIAGSSDESGERGFFSGLNRYDKGQIVTCGDDSRTALEKGLPAVPVHLLHLHGGGYPLSAPRLKRGLACFIAEEIRRLIGSGGPVTASGETGPEPLKLSDIYILTRTAAEGKQIGEMLRRYNVPHAFYKQEGLFNTDEAADVYRLLCAVNAPTDAAARMAAWLTPFFGVPLEELPDWKEAAEGHPLTALLYEWKKIADTYAWQRFFDTILTDSGLVRRLVFAEEERALTNYLHLFELLQAEAHSHPATLDELAGGLKARIDGRKMPEGREGDIQRLETDREAVQILTMHKAKGLEAEVIFIGGGFSNPRISGIKKNIYHSNNRRCLHIGRAYGAIREAVEQEIAEENQRLIYVALTRARSRLYLPWFGKAPEGTGEEEAKGYGYKNLGAFYKGLQKQLDRLAESGRLEDKRLYQVRRVSCREKLPRERKVEPGATGWPEEKSLLEMPLSRAAEAAGIEPLHRGVLLTSYTRMSRGKSWQAPAADVDDGTARRDEAVAGEVEEVWPGTVTTPEKKRKEIYSPGKDYAAADGSGNEEFAKSSESADGTDTGPAGEKASRDRGEGLPGGREAGIFLHSLLEETPVEEIRKSGFDEWAARETVRRRAAAALRRHGFAAGHLAESLQLIYRALRTPLKTQSCEDNARLEMPGGIASGERQRAEMAFVYPIPETFHPQAGSEDADRNEVGRVPYRAVRGYLQGLIDLAFEYDHKIYLLDWKSDRLIAYDRETLQSHVETNYSLQARVYSLAIVRLLNISSEEDYENKFGGILYAFIRGLETGDPDGETRGIWFSRPSFGKIAEWERDFITRREWGGAVIEAGLPAKE
jgi:exodeoxyribonuclease V beta subunit